MSNDSILAKRLYFSQQGQNGSASVDMAINNVGSQDFQFTSIQDNTFITKLMITIIDESGWDFNSFGKDLVLSNGYRAFYTLDGVSKIYLSDAITTNRDHGMWTENITFLDVGGGDNVLIITFKLETPIVLEDTGEIGVELAIDDFSNLTSFNCLITGYTIS